MQLAEILLYLASYKPKLMKKTSIVAIGIGAAVVIGSAFVLSQGGQDIDLNGLTPKDSSFQEPVEVSQNEALTIISFNIRDMAGRQ